MCVVQAPRTLEARCRLKAPTKDPSAPAARMQAKKLMNGARPYGVGNKAGMTHRLRLTTCLGDETASNASPVSYASSTRPESAIGLQYWLYGRTFGSMHQNQDTTTLSHLSPLQALAACSGCESLSSATGTGMEGQGAVRWEAGELEDSGFVLRQRSDHTRWRLRRNLLPHGTLLACPMR